MTLGVSGRLLDRNLVMYDLETGSLWSQMRGVCLQGSAKGTTLDMVPAVFVGYGTWKRMYPATRVLDLGGVRRKAWYYTTEDLARGANDHDDRLGIGLRAGRKSLGISMERLQRDVVVNAKVGDAHVAAVWSEDEDCVLVYVRPSEAPIRIDGNRLASSEGRWNVLTGAASDGSGTLERYPYTPTVWESWVEAHPDGRHLD